MRTNINTITDNYFNRTLDVLVSRGIPNALEICNEITAQPDGEKALSDRAIVELIIESAARVQYEHTGDQRRTSIKTTPQHIKSHSRKRELCELRFICYHLARKYTKLSLGAIGLLFNGRDHSSVIHGIGVYDDLMDYDRNFAKKSESVEYEFGRVAKL